MKLNTHSRARLYALTAGACVAWLVQSLMEANKDGSLLTWPTIIFSLCLLVVIGYTGYCALKDWNAKDDDEDNNDGDGESDNDVNDNDASDNDVSNGDGNSDDKNLVVKDMSDVSRGRHEDNTMH
jgi:uncharacterized membrane protein YebE (DUF533 family)